MARQIRINRAKRKKSVPQDLDFTVIYLPLNQGNGSGTGHRESAKRGASPRKNSEPIPGYQVTVPLLPGLVTFGRTLKEAQEMARDAIECQIAGLRN
jgi:hypothetical protein